MTQRIGILKQLSVMLVVIHECVPWHHFSSCTSTSSYKLYIVWILYFTRRPLFTSHGNRNEALNGMMYQFVVVIFFSPLPRNTTFLNACVFIFVIDVYLLVSCSLIYVELISLWFKSKTKFWIIFILEYSEFSYIIPHKDGYEKSSS